MLEPGLAFRTETVLFATYSRVGFSHSTSISELVEAGVSEI